MEPSRLTHNICLASVEANGAGQRGILLSKSLLPAASLQGSPAMWEPDILRLKANVSGALSCTKAPIQPHGGRANTEEQTPTCTLFPGWQFLIAGSMACKKPLKHRGGRPEGLAA